MYRRLGPVVSVDRVVSVVSVDEHTCHGLCKQGFAARVLHGGVFVPRPAHALHFAVYEAVKDRLGGNETGHNPLVAGFSGAVATAFNDAIMTPADVIKQRLQVDCARSL